MNEENTNEKITKSLIEDENYSRKTFSVMIILGITGALGWIIMFSLGLLINSQVYRDSTLNHFDLVNFMMSLLTFTPTNIALLCLISSFSGGCASRLLIAGIAKKSDSANQNHENNPSDSAVYMAENPFSSMLRGLVVYFAFLAGVFVASSNPFANSSPQQYAQTAGVVSLFSFIVGYDPTAFRSFISLTGKVKQKQGK
jgi:hypothetical protein